MAWQTFVSMFENTLFLVVTGKKETLMITTSKQMPESTLEELDREIKVLSVPQTNKKNRNVALPR